MTTVWKKVPPHQSVLKLHAEAAGITEINVQHPEGRGLILESTGRL